MIEDIFLDPLSAIKVTDEEKKIINKIIKQLTDYINENKKIENI